VNHWFGWNLAKKELEEKRFKNLDIYISNHTSSDKHKGRKIGFVYESETSEGHRRRRRSEDCVQ
jgi:hypothetical protein